jgi:ABC-2 type transport system ATP-binding protein
MIQARGLTKKFSRHEALRGLTFEVAEGSAFALIGANGAGKTTTIKILVNILQPSGGEAQVMGVDSRSISTHELARIGYVSESQDLPGGLTVEQYLAYLRPFYPRWDRELEASALRALHLPPRRRIGDLSHGMTMKMKLACALAFRPKLLILDEPFSGLDPLVRDEVMESLIRQAGETTVLISSHELNEIDHFATHVGYLDDGKLLFSETMADLTERFREVRVTLDHAAAPAALAPGPLPGDWMCVRAAGTVVSFIDSHFSEETLGEKIRSLLSGVRSIDTQPMALRSIFTTLARSLRDSAA